MAARAKSPRTTHAQRLLSSLARLSSIEAKVWRMDQQLVFYEVADLLLLLALLMPQRSASSDQLLA